MTEFQIFGLVVLIFFPLVCWWQISATNALTHSQREAVRELRRLPWNRGDRRSRFELLTRIVSGAFVFFAFIFIVNLQEEKGWPLLFAILFPLPFLVHAVELLFRRTVWLEAGLPNSFLIHEAIANWFGVLFFGFPLIRLIFLGA